MFQCYKFKIKIILKLFNFKQIYYIIILFKRNFVYSLSRFEPIKLETICLIYKYG